MPKGYMSVSIPKQLMEVIEEVIESGETTYSSKTEFIKEAIRLRLREMGKIP